MKPNDTPPAEPVPQTTTVFDPTPMKADEHDWMQRGYMIMDACQPSRPECHNGGIPIKPGQLLVKDAKGNYRFEDETDATIPERQQQRPTESSKD